MSIFDYLFDSEWRQRTDINWLEEKAQGIESHLVRAQTQSQDLQSQVHFLRKEMCRMVLILETLRRVIMEKGICTKDDIDRVMRSVDAEDGVIDGLRQLPPDDRGEVRLCEGCQHFTSTHLPECQYCGKKLHSLSHEPPPSKSNWYWTCSHCGRMNAPSSRGCVNCSTPR